MAGANLVAVPVARLPAGAYQVTLVHELEVKTVQLVKLNQP